MDLDKKMDAELTRKLNILDEAPRRNPEKAAAGRAAFLQEAQDSLAGVTPQAKSRHKGWMQEIQSKFTVRKKEHSPMFGTLATIMVILSLVFGGGGVTVAAAQGSQPDQPLYGIKLWSEDLRLGLTENVQAQSQLSLEFSFRRAEEIRSMIQAGNMPDEAVLTRFQAQLEQAIRSASDLPAGEAIQALEQIRNRLQTLQQSILQVQVNGSPEAEAVLLQVRQMIQERLQWVEEGLLDPQLLQERLRQRDQLQQDEPLQERDQIQERTRLNTAQPEGQGSQSAPGTGSQNPWTAASPEPGSGYGPGDCETCTPTGETLGNNPWTESTPTPGSGYGPGPGPEPAYTCTPQAVNGQGLQPTQQQQGQPESGQPTGSGGNH